MWPIDTDLKEYYEGEIKYKYKTSLKTLKYMNNALDTITKSLSDITASVKFNTTWFHRKMSKGNIYHRKKKKM